MKEVRQSKPRVDLTDREFTYLKPFEYIKGGKWKCKCKCGNEIIVDTRNLNSGHTKSCGCLQRKIASKNTINMIGYEDNNLKVLERDGSSSNGAARWKCICKHCGNIFTTEGKHIRDKSSQSCGCVHSKGEQKIIKILTEAGVEFGTQATIPELKGINGGQLRFDFIILENGQLKHYIEYNGLQHYQKPQGKWGNEWENLIQNDKIKQDYCRKNNIPLKIIKYNQEFTLKDLI